MSAHTRGTWTVRPDGGIDTDGDAVRIVTVVQPGAIGWAPDAKLIAAAPELFQALDELLAEFDLCNEQGYPDTFGIELARAAIAKAEGKP